MRRFTLVSVFALVAALILSAGIAQSIEELTNPAAGDWPTYGRDLEMTRYSPLDQINSDNVANLRLAWTVDADYEGAAGFSPAVYNGVMYINGPDRVVAIDASNGNPIWTYITELHENTGFVEDRTRGSVIVYDGKIYDTIADGRVVALDIDTGEELWSTQVGAIEFGEGFSAGPIFADGKIVVGPSGADIGGANGRVLALDAENGEVLWTFHVIPQPGEPGFETWDPPESAAWGGGSAWNPGAYDPVSRTVVYGAGQPVPWENWGIRGGVSDDLYTSSKLGIDVDTGQLKWYRQVVPGDEWDYDQHTTPTVADIEIMGMMQRVVINPTTSGYIELLDPDTGEFITAHGYNPEYTVHMGYEDDGTPIIDPNARFYNPDSGTPGAAVDFMLCPFRWVNWEPGAFSPQTGLYYRPQNNDCWNYTNNGTPPDWAPGEGPLDIDLTLQVDRFEHLGELKATNVYTGEVAWSFPSPYAMQSAAGLAVTAGNLVFFSHVDRVFRALDATTGEVLWQQIVSAASQSNPITYMVDGVQYVAVPVGTTTEFTGQTGTPPTVSGDTVIYAFALPPMMAME